MPRDRKRTQSGYPAQKVESVPGRRYGEGVKSAALQAAMPTPDMTQPLPAGPAAAPSPTPGPVGPDPGLLARVPQLMAPYANQLDLLHQPTARPGEPVTTGLRSGPGPGPEVLSGYGSTSPIGQFFREVAAATGDQQWARLADGAGL